jgi:PAS domain S-box-containing protein
MMDVGEESPESSRFAEDIVETIREPLLVLDKNRRVLSANPAFYRTFHVDPEETQGVLVYELGNGQWDIPRLRQLLEEILPESTTIEDFEVDHEFPEIGHRVMVLNARRLDDGNKILLAIEDITERKRLEDKLRDASEYAQNIVNTVREPLVVLDDEFRVISANRSFYRTFKVTPEMSENTMLFDLGNRQWDIPKLRELLEEVLPKSTSIEDFEVEHGFPAIGRKTMLINARRIRSKTGATQILLAIEDITERKRAEEELKRINREMEGFAHTVSHDLRSPVTSIGMATGLLEDRLKDLSGGGVDEEAAELIDSIKRNVERASSLITDLLSLAQVGLVPESIESVDVKAVIGSVMEEVTPLLEEEAAVIEVGDDMGRIMANPTQIRQVFANLIKNALEHARGGQLVIKVSYLGQDTDGAHRYLTRDNGSGIPPEDMDLVFAPFFKGETGGTGIGLATVERIVNFYGGTVRAYNDAGACFEFTVNDYAADG